MTKTDFPHGDIKYYYQIHVKKQKERWLHPVAYENFYKRLRKWYTLHDAIYMPRCEYNVREYPRQPIQDWIRRAKVLKDENVLILTFEEIEKVENKHHLTPKTIPMAKYNMKPKKTLLQKFISLFQKKWQKKES